MRSSTLVLTSAFALMFFSSCQSNTGTGVLAGGALGAGAGALIGGGQGALIGGAIGVIGGGLIGAALDNQEQENLKRQSPQTYNRVDNGEQLSVNDIISLHQAHISDSKIIELIDKTGSTYKLNTYQIDRLKKAGVSDTVINYMMNT